MDSRPGRQLDGVGVQGAGCAAHAPVDGASAGQAVRLPNEFALPSREVLVPRVGNAVLIIPVGDP